MFLFPKGNCVGCRCRSPSDCAGLPKGPLPKLKKCYPQTSCPMVKATYGRAINNTCPIFPLADVIVGETTCDGRKKMYELLGREKTMHVMDLPQRPEDPEAKVHWRGEIEKLKNFIEEQLDVRITDDALKKAIVQGNRERALALAIHECRKIHPPSHYGTGSGGHIHQNRLYRGSGRIC